MNESEPNPIDSKTETSEAAIARRTKMIGEAMDFDSLADVVSAITEEDPEFCPDVRRQNDEDEWEFVTVSKKLQELKDTLTKATQTEGLKFSVFLEFADRMRLFKGYTRTYGLRARVEELARSFLEKKD